MNKAYPNELKDTICQKICVNRESTSQVAKSFNVPLKTVEKWVTAFNRNPEVFKVSDDYRKRFQKEKKHRYNDLSTNQLIQELKQRDTEISYLKSMIDISNLIADHN